MFGVFTELRKRPHKGVFDFTRKPTLHDRKRCVETSHGDDVKKRDVISIGRVSAVEYEDVIVKLVKCCCFRMNPKQVSYLVGFIVHKMAVENLALVEFVKQRHH